MALNESLHKAKAQKRDEFYTQLPDIENELRHYKDHFRGKHVYCNCDDPKVSNFFHYFSHNFKALGLRQLTATCYKSGTWDLFSSHDSDTAIALNYWGTVNDDNIPSDNEISTYRLIGDGDFRSRECIDILKSADIVVTNPPFSLFREYVAQLIEYDKKFLILGQQNALTYKEIFPLIKDGKIWLGVENGGTKWFQVNPDYSIKTAGRQKTENGLKYISMGNIAWFTNLDHYKRHEKLIFYKSYTPEDYPKYDNYEAIEVSRYLDIPADYDGAMGVPITFLDKYNPDQFEILGATESEGKGFSAGLWRSEIGTAQGLVYGKRVYKRLFIRKKRA